MSKQVRTKIRPKAKTTISIQTPVRKPAIALTEKPKSIGGVFKPKMKEIAEKPSSFDDKDTKKERLQKVMAKAGIASRRKAELLILEGKVTVNGRTITELGTKVDPDNDKIKVEGKMIYTEVDPLYVALYKPKGMISALSDPEGRPHIGQLLRHLPTKVNPIGRMDFNSEGLLLLTNDGTLANKIQKAQELPKTYLVKIKGHPNPKDLDFLKKGLFTNEGVVRFSSYALEQKLRNKSWLKLEVVEGAKLDLKELLNHRGIMVDKIIRTAIGNIALQELQPGDFRLLKKKEVENLLHEKA